MALGQIRDGKKVVFEGDYKLLDFTIHKATAEFNFEWASYQLLTNDGQFLKLSGWVDSGCDLLKTNETYHFYFSYTNYNGVVKVQVIGCNPNIYTDTKVVDKPIEMNL